MNSRKIGLYEIVNYFFAFVFANIGAVGLKDFPKNWLTNLTLIALGFLLIYLSSYISQINKNEKGVENIESKINELENKFETNEKLLNTLKDIILLKKK